MLDYERSKHGGLIMELKDFSTEELKAELKRRSDFAKAEKAEVKM